MRKDLLYIRGSFNKLGSFFYGGGTCYIYKGRLLNKGFFIEEGPIVYLWVIQ